MHVNIKNTNELKSIIDYLYRKNVYDIIIEEQIHGEDYRVVCYQDKVIDVVNRTPPTIIGNGENTINELVYKYNRENILIDHLRENIIIIIGHTF